MKKILFIIVLITLQVVQIQAQQTPIGRQISTISSEQFSKVNLFSSKAMISERAVTLSQHVTKFNLLEVDAGALDKIATNKTDRMEIDLPLGGSTITLQLVRGTVINAQTVFTTQDGAKKDSIDYKPAAYYHGIIKNKPNTLAAISFFNNDIIGVVSDENGNQVLGKSNIKDSRSTEYILYNERDLKIQNTFVCGTVDDNAPAPMRTVPLPTMQNVYGCIRTYIVTDYRLFLNEGSNVTNVINYVSGLFNVVATLYRNESINTIISEVNINIGPDRFMGADAETTLELFQEAFTSGYNGDVAVLFSARVLTGDYAGLAEIDGLCGSYSNGMSICSSLDNVVIPLPTFSWNAFVVAHEMGHTLGSRHTHSCSWGPLGNTAIDGCATREGNCMDGPLPPLGGGTIMSYCHTLPTTVGINFANGFGPEPGDKIRDEVATAMFIGCIQSCCPANVTISQEGFFVPITQSSGWIKSVGKTWVSVQDAIRFDADPVNGYVELNAANASDYFLARPLTQYATFVAQALDGCGGFIPSKHTDTNEPTEKNNAGSKNITVYPNPSNGQFNLDIKFDTKKNIKIYVYDMLGEEVYVHDFGVLSEVQTRLNLNEQKEGLYLIRVQADNEAVSKQIVLVR